MIERCREILAKAGYPMDFADRAYGFVTNSDYLRYIRRIFPPPFLGK